MMSSLNSGVGRQYFVNLDDTVAQKVSSLGFTSYAINICQAKTQIVKSWLLLLEIGLLIFLMFCRLWSTRTAREGHISAALDLAKK